MVAAGVAYASARRSAAQTAVPTPVPVRIQTPDLAFADALQQSLATYGKSGESSGLTLSIVAAEPASDQLLNDARGGGRRFSGAFIPQWLVPDLVRDNFVLLAEPPPAPLPLPVAQLRSFGGNWVATDLDHDCDLFYFRRDLLEDSKHRETYSAATGTPLGPPATWDELEQQASFFASEIGGGIALPQTHAQQVVDHFASMTASFVIDATNANTFWFDPESMEPSIGSDGHNQALETWRRLARTTPAPLREGNTGDLWRAFLDRSVAFLIASSDFLPFALEQGADPGIIGIAALPGRSTDSGVVVSAGNTTGASWGGVVMRDATESAAVARFLDELTTTETQQRLWSDASTGITPAVTPETASSQARALESAGWPDELSASWLQAIQATFSNPVQLPNLRIAETRRYLQALEDRIVPFLAGESGTAAETLHSAADDWRQINDAIGIDVQRDLYSRSLMPAPEVATTSKTR